MASTDGSGAAPSPSPAPAKRLDFGADVAGELLARPFSLSPPISPPIDPSSMTSTAHPHTRPQDSMAVDDGHRRGEGGTEGVQSQLPAQFYTQSSAHPQSQSHSQSQDEGYQLWLAHQSKLDEEQRKQQQQQQQQSPGGESGASPDAGMAWRASPGLNDDEMRDGFLQAENSDHTTDEEDWDTELMSVTSSVLDYEYENGRRYHGYRAGHYPLPNDETELDRLDLQYHVFTLVMSGELYLAPLDPQKVKRVLDIGTGTGLWAVEMAYKHPQAHVLGVDLSPVQPEMVPENLSFEIDDLESEWLYRPEEHFDFIHSRIMLGAISDWQALLGRSFQHLRPGGWFELQELDPRVLSDDGSHARSPMNVAFNEQILDASERYGKPVLHHTQWRRLLEAAGFLDVHARFFKVPMNAWPRDRHLKEVGRFQLINYHEGYEAIGVGLYTRALGWTHTEFMVFLAKIRTELRDRSLHTYHTFAVVYGRKPLEHELAAQQQQQRAYADGHARADSTGPKPGATPATGKKLPPVPLFSDSPPARRRSGSGAAAGSEANSSSASGPEPAPLGPGAAGNRPGAMGRGSAQGEPELRPSYPGAWTFKVQRPGTSGGGGSVSSGAGKEADRGSRMDEGK